MDFKIEDVNNGHCQITYRTKNRFGETIFYALQDHFGIRLVRCSRDFEPQCEAHIKNKSVWSQFEIPKGDSQIEKDCRDFLLKNQGEIS